MAFYVTRVINFAEGQLLMWPSWSPRRRAQRAPFRVWPSSVGISAAGVMAR